MGAQISRGKQRLLIWTPGPRPPGPPSLPSPIMLPNNDSYRQNSAVHFFTFDRICFYIGVFRLHLLIETNDNNDYLCNILTTQKNFLVLTFRLLEIYLCVHPKFNPKSLLFRSITIIYGKG